jgi:hypothetical protein
MSLADRLARIVAPASAANVLGGRGTPEVLADFDVEHAALEVARREQELAAKRDIGAEQSHGARDGLRCGRKLPLLVELAVVGQVALRHNAEYPAVLEHDRAVEETAIELQRASRR